MTATTELFRTDSYRQRCTATVLDARDDSIVLDQTVFFPTGGGQPGDSGTLRGNGTEVTVADTYQDGDGAIRHLLRGAAEPLAAGSEVTAALDWSRRYRHMRMHTAMHLLCAAVAAPVTGGQVGETKSRLDFNIAGTSLDKADLTARLNAMVAADHPISLEWWSADALQAKPELVRTMAVQPPMDQGQVRLVRIGDVDLQACGGTHVARTGEIAELAVTKIENKGKQNRRVVIALTQDSEEAA